MKKMRRQDDVGRRQGKEKLFPAKHGITSTRHCLRWQTVMSPLLPKQIMSAPITGSSLTRIAATQRAREREREKRTSLPSHVLHLCVSCPHMATLHLKTKIRSRDSQAQNLRCPGVFCAIQVVFLFFHGLA